jgi:preprotein translocase subunit SecG
VTRGRRRRAGRGGAELASAVSGKIFGGSTAVGQPQERFGMYILFVVIHVLVSIVLCVAILLQNSKGGGLAGAFGGAGGAPQQLLGSRGMTTLLHKVTIWCGVGFMVTSLALFMMSGSQNAGGGSVLEEAQERGEIAPDLPGAPITDEALPPMSPPADQTGGSGGAADAPAGGSTDDPSGTSGGGTSDDPQSSGGGGQ